MSETPRRFKVEVLEEAPDSRRAPPPMNDATLAQELFEHVHARHEREGYHPEHEYSFEKPGGNPHEEHEMAESPAGETLMERLVEAIRTIYDPEIPVNIYDLGLIYDITEEDDGHFKVTMTLTTPNCPVAESMPGEVETRLLAVPGVASVDVSLVWDPPWNPDTMTDEAKLELGML